MRASIASISATTFAVTLAIAGCTKSKSSDPAPEQPAAQGAPQAPQAPQTTQQNGQTQIPQTQTQVQVQFQQQQQQIQGQMPFQVTQQAFSMRLFTSIVGEPDLEVALFPNMKDANGNDVVLPYTVDPIMAGTQIAIPSNSRVWGKMKLVSGGQSVFTAGGFILPNGVQYATTAMGLVQSDDILKANWTSYGINGLIGAGAGSAIGLILALTTGDKKVQAWEVLTGTGAGAALGALSAMAWPTNGDRLISIKADNTLAPISVYFNLSNPSAVPGYKVPQQQQQQQQQQQTQPATK